MADVVWSREWTEKIQALQYAQQQCERAHQVRWDAVRRAREAGVTWTAIGSALGVSRQAATERFRDVERSDAA
jgi:hypothetical protein